MPEDQIQREDTMLYREPTPESAEVVDIWGKKLETRVVDASEVPAMLHDGWVTNPLHIDHPPKPEEAAGFVPDRGPEIDALKTAITEAKEREDALAAEVTGLKDELQAARASETELAGKLKGAEDRAASLVSDLKAAEELASAESKAKDDALARVAELEAAAKAGKPRLGVKKDG